MLKQITIQLDECQIIALDRMKRPGVSRNYLIREAVNDLISANTK